MYFLLNANYKPTQWSDGFEDVQIPAGSFVTSYPTVMADCRLSKQQIRDAFAHLARTGFAAYWRTPRWTRVTVNNWDTYQGPIRGENTAENTFETAKGTPDKEIKNKTTTHPSPDGDDRDCSDRSKTPPNPSQAPPFASKRKSRGRFGELTAEQEQRFEQWWPIYWRREAKEAARRAFAQHVPDEEVFLAVMEATRLQNAGMANREQHFRPLGSTWLGEKRWLDEVPEPYLQNQQSGQLYKKWDPEDDQ